MKRARYFTALVLVPLLVLGLMSGAGCGHGDEASPTTTTQPPITSQPTTTPESTVSPEPTPTEPESDLDYVVVDTGQDKCYDNSQEIACPEKA